MKGNITISVDVEVIGAIRNQDINISGLVNEFLRNHLKLVKEKKFDKSLLKGMAKKVKEQDGIEKARQGLRDLGRAWNAKNPKK